MVPYLVTRAAEWLTLKNPTAPHANAAAAAVAVVMFSIGSDPTWPDSTILRASCGESADHDLLQTVVRGLLWIAPFAAIVAREVIMLAPTNLNLLRSKQH